MITLLSVVGDSDVRAKDTEVGRGTPLTSPFIEGIYEDHAALLGNAEWGGRPSASAYSIDSSARPLASLGMTGW